MNDTNYGYPSYQMEPPHPKRSRSFGAFWAGLAGILCGALLIWGLFALINPTQAPLAVGDKTKPSPVLFDENIVTQVAKNVGPAVVGISTTQISYDSFLQQYPSQGVGSGFILNQEGYIMTNAHVVAGASNINVTLSDGRKLPGTLIGMNRVEDIAVVKITAQDLPTVELGDSDGVQVGQMAIAIGNPLGLELQRTVTVGIISAVARSLTDSDGNTHEDMLQTDASINFGNSGGPLVNAAGQVIGINTAKIAGAEGLGFAIPINTAWPIAEDIIKNGGSGRAWLGISGTDITDDVAAYYSLPVNRGVLILQVVEGGAAATAGLQPGDIITRINESKTDGMKDLQKALGKLKPGTKCTLELISGGQTKTAMVVLGQAPQ